MDNGIGFTEEEVQKMKVVGGGWDEDMLVRAEPENEKKLLNGRYRKIKKLGAGSYNVVYLAEDLLPDGKNRLLSKHHREMISKIPESMLNPYRQAQHSYFDYDDDQE